MRSGTELAVEFTFTQPLHPRRLFGDGVKLRTASEYKEKAMDTSEFRFTENEPTPIVKDFNTFVNYIEETSFALGGKSGHIPYKHLVALNESMSSPNTGNTPRTPQRFTRQPIPNANTRRVGDIWAPRGPPQWVTNPPMRRRPRRPHGHEY